jgi:hypothetical protein
VWWTVNLRKGLLHSGDARNLPSFNRYATFLCIFKRTKINFAHKEVLWFALRDSWKWVRRTYCTCLGAQCSEKTNFDGEDGDSKLPRNIAICMSCPENYKPLGWRARQMMMFTRFYSRTLGTILCKALGLFVSRVIPHTWFTYHRREQMRRKVAEFFSQQSTLNFWDCKKYFAKHEYLLCIRGGGGVKICRQNTVCSNLQIGTYTCDFKDGGRQFEQFVRLVIVSSCCCLVVSKVVF